MELPQGFDVDCFLKAVCEGDLHTLQGFVEKFENGEGPGKVWYAGLRAPSGTNALHWAAELGKISTCRYLIEKLKFNIDETTENGETPLHRAIMGKHRPTVLFFINIGTKEFVKLLVLKGADLSATSVRGMPLHCAAATGSSDILGCLLDLKADAGADPNRPSQYSTPLWYAAGELDEGCIRRLLKAGANPNTPGFGGQTPLEHAALLDRWKVMKLLFPVTSRIGCYPDWSIRGVIKHAQSEENIVLLESKFEEFTKIAKTKGRNAFEGKRYLDAINWYDQAIEIDPTDAKVLFNRSLCHTNLNQHRDALEDASCCIVLEPRWAKAHYRGGAAWKALKDFKKAAEAFSRALSLDPSNKEIQEALRAARMWTKKPLVEYFGKV